MNLTNFPAKEFSEQTQFLVSQLNSVDNKKSIGMSEKWLETAKDEISRAKFSYEKKDYPDTINKIQQSAEMLTKAISALFMGYDAETNKKKISHFAPKGFIQLVKFTLNPTFLKLLKERNPNLEIDTKKLEDLIEDKTKSEKLRTVSYDEIKLVFNACELIEKSPASKKLDTLLLLFTNNETLKVSEFTRYITELYLVGCLTFSHYCRDRYPDDSLTPRQYYTDQMGIVKSIPILINSLDKTEQHLVLLLNQLKKPKIELTEDKLYEIIEGLNNCFYKETEIGNIPIDWEVKYLSELGELNRGKSKHRPRDAAFLYNGPYPFIQTGDIRLSGGRITTYTQTYSEDGLKQSRLWPKGTVCITIAANIAETGILTFPACFPDSIIGFIANPQKVNNLFVEYSLRHLKNKIKSEAIGSVQDNINLATFERVPIIYPKIQEQQAIVDVLSCLDDKIELNREMNKTLEEIAQALFKRWFVDFEFPNENGEPYKSSGGKMKQTEQGGIPENWNVKSIDEIAEFLNGLALQKYPAQENEEYLPVIKIRELKQGVTDSSDRANTTVPEKYVVDNGDVLFSWSGSLEVVIWTNGKGALNQHLFKVMSSNYPKWFYYYWILQYLPNYRRIAEDKATTMGHIQRQHLTNSLVLIPTKETLLKMDKILSPIIDKLIAIKVESNELVQIRDLLLPKLMSGKIRVPVHTL